MFRNAIVPNTPLRSCIYCFREKWGVVPGSSEAPSQVSASHPKTESYGPALGCPRAASKVNDLVSALSRGTTAGRQTVPGSIIHLLNLYFWDFLEVRTCANAPDTINELKVKNVSDLRHFRLQMSDKAAENLNSVRLLKVTWRRRAQRGHLF